MEKIEKYIPSLHIKASNLPEACWKAIEAVQNRGYELRTQYDRKDSYGNFIDPPGRDAKVMIQIDDTFKSPRYPLIGFSELGKIIAEYLGAKDHLVPSYETLYKLVEKARSENRKVKDEETLWPYTYFWRLTNYPTHDGKTINQLENMINDLARNPITRRAVAITAVPEIDQYLEADQPCLRQIQLRLIENENREFLLYMDLTWRSRDLIKAWSDNIIGITNLHSRLAHELSEKIGKEVKVGPYYEYNSSLHIYGQDYTDKKFIPEVFFKKYPSAEAFVNKCKEIEEFLRDKIIDDLEKLKKESTWKFPISSIKLIEKLIDDFKSGRFIP
ncbi:MAG: thymidylate synthase [Candidatus Pacearchaeota archaeon]